MARAPTPASASAPADGARATPPPQLNLDAANDLLAAFDVADDPESQQFLADLLASGTVPPEEVELLTGTSKGEGEKKSRRRRGKSRSKSKARTESGFESRSPTPTPSPSKRRRKQEDQKETPNPKQKDVKKAVKSTGDDPFSVGLKTSVSPFFIDDAASSSDESDDSIEEDFVRMTRRANIGIGGNDNKKDGVVKAEGQPSLSPSTFTETLVVYTRRTVMGGNPKQTPTKVTSPTKVEVKQQTTRTPSPTKRVKNEHGSPSSACFSPAPSPALSTPKRKRETTSYFFTPPSSHHRQKDGGSSDEDSSPSDSSKTSPSPRNNAKKKAGKDRPRRGTVSSLPFPRLDAPHFGLVQEQLSTDPFWLLIALVFLTRVAGRVSLPVFWALKEKYPSPQALVDADPHELVATMRHLGMATVRCVAIQRCARGWLQRPPQPGVCTTVKNYPTPPEGYPSEDENDDEDSKDRKIRPDSRGPSGSQWEIGHLTQGSYAVDSWRIFCRDGLLGRSSDWKGDDGGCMAGRIRDWEKFSRGEISDAESVFSPGSDRGIGRTYRPRSDEPFQPEWMRVLPRDKELRACLRWMWMREGWDWDPRTGERTVLSEELREAVDEGRVGYDNKGQLQIVERDPDTKVKKKEVLEVIL